MTKEIFIVTVVTVTVEVSYCMKQKMQEPELTYIVIRLQRITRLYFFYFKLKKFPGRILILPIFSGFFFSASSEGQFCGNWLESFFKRLPESNLSGGFNGNCHNCPSTQFLIYNSVRVILHRWKLILDYSIERSRKGFYVSAPVSLFNKCVKVLTSFKRYLFFPLKLF